jgi:hypothetical protein
VVGQLLTKDKRVVVCDFALSRITGHILARQPLRPFWRPF